jgi:hypothetical protein
LDYPDIWFKDGIHRLSMVRCYSTGETYEHSEIRWTPKSKLQTDIGFDVENIRGDDMLQDFLPNAHPLGEEIEV